MADELLVAAGLKRRAAIRSSLCMKEERNAIYKKVSTVLKKSEEQRSEKDGELLRLYPDIAKEVANRAKKRLGLQDRQKEIEDPLEILDEKCKVLAEAIRNAKNLVVYTGAGISTAAKIPDYRGPSGIWTLLQKGQDIGSYDLTEAEPTVTHMAIRQLYTEGIVKHVVSQNCDGLHLRSGLPHFVLSEVHGNMYIEVCKHCNPPREYLRLFDVTEHTAKNSHKTGRRCYTCGNALTDSIVHFGERGTLRWPLNWQGAVKAAERADVILCLGSSLKVLRRYPWLWGMDKALKKRPKVYIVNLQWTPKDSSAALKINGQCDLVMTKVMALLDVPIPSYVAAKDPLFQNATPLNELEYHTTTRSIICLPEKVDPDPGGSGILCDEKDISRILEEHRYANIPTETKPSVTNTPEPTSRYVRYTHSFTVSPICECCDDNGRRRPWSVWRRGVVEPEPEGEESEEEEEESDHSESTASNDTTTEEEKPQRNPGWFGKGWRVRKRKKRC